MKTIHEMIEVMQAAERGEQIQYKRSGHGWRECESEPAWDWRSFDYRVKPQPREWFIAMADGMCCGFAYASEVDIPQLPPTPSGYAWPKREIVRVREVIYEENED